jgi:TerC family integral membrane protein
MTTDTFAWIALAGAFALLVAVDLLIFARGRMPSIRAAAAWSVAWFALGLAFTGVVWWWRGGEAGGAYLAGYLIERSLSIDNLFVFTVILSALAVPERQRPRVLLWGIAGALVLRMGFVLGGIELLDRLSWSAYVLGGLLVATGVRMAWPGGGGHSSHDRFASLLGRFVPVARGDHGDALLARQGGRLAATSLLAALVAVAAADVLFAVDSIPAILAITDDPFVVITANVMALLGLRALFVCLAGLIDRFVYLGPGLAVVLVFIGLKAILGHSLVEIPIALSLGVVVGTVAAAIAASLLRTRRLAGSA